MRITLITRDFLKDLQAGGSFAGRSKVLPILDCVKIRVNGNDGYIVSTDNENAISSRFVVEENGGDFTVCVNYKDVLGYVKLIKDDMFVMEYVPDNNTMLLKHSKGSTEIPVFDATNFPQMRKDGDEVSFDMDSALLNNWIVDGSKFVANDELRPQMNGIYVYFGDGKIGFCASDGHSLCCDEVVLDGYDGIGSSFIINKNALTPLLSALSSGDTVHISSGTRNTTFRNDKITLMTRNTEGKYPNFKSVIPDGNNIEVKLDKKALLDAISRCKLSASASSLLKMSFGMMSLSIEANDIDFSKKAMENLDCQSNGEITIGLNGEKLSKCVSSIDTDTVVLTMSKPSTPVLILEDDPEAKKKILLMPMMLND